VQQVTAEVLQAIGCYKAPRCCQRDCWVALKEVARLSKRYVGVSLRADLQLACLQSDRNRECIRAMCPLYGNRQPEKGPIRERAGRSKPETHGTFAAGGS